VSADLKVYGFNIFYKKICKSFTIVSFIVGHLPQVSFVCFIILFLWLHNILQWNIKLFVVRSYYSSSHGHFGLSISPNLWRYDLSVPCPVWHVLCDIFCVTCSYSLESLLAQCIDIIIGNNGSSRTSIVLSDQLYFTDTEWL